MASERKLASEGERALELVVETLAVIWETTYCPLTIEELAEAAPPKYRKKVLRNLITRIRRGKDRGS